MRTLTCSGLLLCPLLLSAPGLSLEQAGIDSAIERGQSAGKAAEVPALLKMARLSVDEGTYVFYAGTCRHWIANLSFSARRDQRPLDEDVIRERCLHRDELHTVVSGQDRDGLGDPGDLPPPEEPVIDLRVRVDGHEYRLAAPERFADYGIGNAFGIFGPLELSAESDMMLTATLASGTNLSIKVKRKQLKRLF